MKFFALQNSSAVTYFVLEAVHCRKELARVTLADHWCSMIQVGSNWWPLENIQGWQGLGYCFLIANFVPQFPEKYWKILPLLFFITLLHFIFKNIFFYRWWLQIHTNSFGSWRRRRMRRSKFSSYLYSAEWPTNTGFHNWIHRIRSFRFWPLTSVEAIHCKVGY